MSSNSNPNAKSPDVPGGLDIAMGSANVSTRLPRIINGVSEPSLRANGSRECAPDDRLREAIHRAEEQKAGLLRRFAPRNDDRHSFAISPRVFARVLP
jgi:hypothetical protein